MTEAGLTEQSHLPAIASIRDALLPHNISIAAKLLTSGSVQVFGRRNAETVQALGRRRRKSAKARNRGEVGRGRCGRRYGDLASV